MSYRQKNINWLEEVILPAIDLFYSTPIDRDLIQRDVNERTIAANIYGKVNAILLSKRILTRELRNLGVDTEYDLNVTDKKWVYGKCVLCQIGNCFIKEESYTYTTSLPDLIIHQRGTNEDNQVVIEFKKVSKGSGDDRNKDKAKLIYFTCQQPFPEHEIQNYQYCLGFFIDLDLAGYYVTTYLNATYDVPRYRHEGAWV